MPDSMFCSRRGFIKTAVTAALAAGSMSSWTASAARGRKPAWPLACRDVYLRHADPESSWNAMKIIGLDAVEVTVGLNGDLEKVVHRGKKYTIAADDGIRQIKDDLQEAGVRIAAFCMYNNFEKRLDQEMESARRIVKAGTALDVKTVRVDVAPHGTPADQFFPFAVKVCKQLAGIAEGTPFRFGIENHGLVTNDPDFMLRLFDAVRSPCLGITLDTANLYWFGHPLDKVYRIFRQYAPYAVHTHCKSIRYPEHLRNVQRERGLEYAKRCCPIYEGDIDFRKVIALLRKAKYPGTLCIENESLDRYPAAERAEILKKETAYLQKMAS